jgi:septum formation inhibitor-activating ATPase MinD
MSSHLSPIAVVAASGGLGASTLALAVGRRLADTGPPSVVVDLDLVSGGLEVTAGLEHLPGRRWDDLRDVRGRVPPDPLLSSLPGEDDCRVLSARGGSSEPVPESAVRDVLDSLAAASALVVLDVPRASPLLGAVLAAAPLVLVLVGLRTRGLADADAVVERLADRSASPDRSADLHLVTRGRRATGAVLDDLVDHLGVPHLHHVTDDPQVIRDAERGMFPGTGRDAVRRCADSVVDLVDGLPAAS